MNAIRQLQNLGQSLWLDNITRELLASGTLARYIRELGVTGLTSNPSIFEHALRNSDAYDQEIGRKVAEGKSGEALFFELALADLSRAAACFLPIFEATAGTDGWVSLEISPLLAQDADASLQAARQLHVQGECRNLFIKIPGNGAGLAAVEEAIFVGVPVNITLLFSRQHYLAAAEAYMRGLERRIAAGLDLQVSSVASLFISRWDVAVADKVPPAYHNRLGIAVGMSVYAAYREVLASPRWQKLAAAGARPQRLLWASTGTKDPAARDTLYVEALAAADTINTLPENTLLAFAEYGQATRVLPLESGQGDACLAEFEGLGIDIELLAADLQRDGTAAFARSWGELMARVAAKSASLANHPTPE